MVLTVEPGAYNQVGEALRLVYREKGQEIPERVLYPYPLPDTLGLTLDPKQRARILAVADGSSAQKDGFQPGDEWLRERVAIAPLVDVEQIDRHVGQFDHSRLIGLAGQRRHPPSPR